MSQITEFPVRREFPENAVYVEIEPGDATRYRFLVAASDSRHDWDPVHGMVVMVASVDGPLLPGVTMPYRDVLQWWRDTKDMTPQDSLAHQEIEWLIGAASIGLVKQTVNPWTARGALLAVLKWFEEI